MPKIFEYLGFIFFFYSNDHKPLHVHARYGEYESVIELEISEGKLVNIKFKRSTGSKPIPPSYRKDIEKFVFAYYLKIVEKWTQFYLLKIEPKNEKITRKIR
ncbi:MAG: DUF4160 domain-containing protein [Prolixibacteraceae bacterium]|nr:DUF4160 domain-containing protein [Prolixibacteraceae bacterium]